MQSMFLNVSRAQNYLSYGFHTSWLDIRAKMSSNYNQACRQSKGWRIEACYLLINAEFSALTRIFLSRLHIGVYNVVHVQSDIEIYIYIDASVCAMVCR